MNDTMHDAAPVWTATLWSGARPATTARGGVEFPAVALGPAARTERERRVQDERLDREMIPLLTHPGAAQRRAAILPGAVVRTALHILAPVLVERSVCTVLRGVAGNPSIVRVCCDPATIARIVTNELSNAVLGAEPASRLFAEVESELPFPEIRVGWDAMAGVGTEEAALNRSALMALCGGRIERISAGRHREARIRLPVALPVV